MTLFHFFSKNKKGFTVIELMVVVSIIGILSTIAFTSFSEVQKKSRVVKRVSDLKQMEVALEYYYAVNRSYPSTSGTWRSECNAWGGYTPSNVIPGLTPNYMSTIPADPRMDKTANTSCYRYSSDGTNYALLDYDVTELVTAPYSYSTYPELIDPARDSGTNSSIVDGTGIWSWKIYRGTGLTW